jgi:hypothetical protein
MEVSINYSKTIFREWEASFLKKFFKSFLDSNLFCVLNKCLSQMHSVRGAAWLCMVMEERRTVCRAHPGAGRGVSKSLPA